VSTLLHALQHLPNVQVQIANKVGNKKKIAGIGCHVVSAKDSYGRILGFKSEFNYCVHTHFSDAL
jgi:hypothetical protein